MGGSVGEDDPDDKWQRRRCYPADQSIHGQQSAISGAGRFTKSVSDAVCFPELFTVTCRFAGSVIYAFSDAVSGADSCNTDGIKA